MKFMHIYKGIAAIGMLCLSVFGSRFVNVQAEQAAQYGVQMFTTICDGGATVTIYDSDADEIADTLVVSGSGATDNYKSKTDTETGAKYADTPYKEYANDITKVVIEKEVSALGDRTFFYMTNIEHVIFETESTLISTGQGVFHKCEKLKEIEIPKSVASLGMETFGSCTALETVIFSENTKLTTIGGYCFSDCTSMKEIILPDSVTALGEFAFQSCENLESIILPKNLTGALDFTFIRCKKLKSIEIPDGVTKLGNKAFASCYALTEVIFSENTKCNTIGDYVFADCDALETLTIPKTVTTIGYRVVERCDGLKVVTIETTQLTPESMAGGLIVVSKVKTIVYPEKYMENDGEILDLICKGMSGVSTQLATTEESDGTISVKVIAVGDGVTVISVPGVIAGKKLGKITYADGIDAEKIKVGCHIDSMKIDASGHWQEETVCSICNMKINKIEKTPHVYQKSEMPCECGFVQPIVITGQPVSRVLTYGYSSYNSLFAYYKRQVGAQVSSSYWTVNGEVVPKQENLASNEYRFYTGKDAGEYIIIYNVCTQSYKINGVAVKGEAYEFVQQSRPAVITVKKRPITVRISDVEKCVGEENPEFSFEFVNGSLVEGDTIDDWEISYETDATTDSAVGEYEITGTVKSKNYEVTVLPGVLNVQENVSDSGNTGDTDNTVTGNDTESGNVNGGSPEEEATQEQPQKDQTQKDQTQVTLPKKGDKLLTKKAVYKVIKSGDFSGKIGTVSYVKPRKKTISSVTIPTTIKVGNITYKVVAIESKAFMNCKKLKKVTIGKNVAKIGKKAFYKCKKLKTVIIKTKKLTAKKVGSKAFSKINSKAKIKVPKSKYKSYKKWLKKKGVGTKVKIRKM